MRMSVGFEGLQDLMRDMRALSDEADHEIGRAIKETTAEAYRIIVDATPGTQKREWDMRTEGLKGEVTTNSKVNWFLEWGTGLHSEAKDGKRAKYKIEAKNAKALAFPWTKAPGRRFHVASRLDGKALFRSKQGNLTTNAGNAANMVMFRSVMHPGIKPRAMVRGNLPKLRERFHARMLQAADRLLRKVSL